MNITIVSHYFYPEIGAPSARIYDLAQCWIGAGHQVDVVTGFPNHPLGELYDGYQLSRYQHEVVEGINVHRNWTYITPNRGFLKRTIGHVSLWPSSRFKSTRQIAAPDVVIGTSPTFFAAMAARGIAETYQVPFVMEVRDLWPGIFVDLGVITQQWIINLLEAWELWMYREADQVVTVTESFRDNIVARGIPAPKVAVVPNGADLTFFQPGGKPKELNAKLGLEDKFVVLYLGAHGVSQGLEDIIRTAKQLETYQEILFLFVGGGNQKQKIMEFTEDQDVDNVIFHEPILKSEVPDFYKLADICLVPLRDIELFKTFIPSKMFEIMAMEKPMVASLEGEAKRILENSGSAVVVPPEDSSAIGKAILKIYQEHNLKSEMGKSGRQFVEEHYSRESLAQKYLEILR